MIDAYARTEEAQLSLRGIDEATACLPAAKSRKAGNRVGALMSRCAGTRESPALLPLAAGLLCLAVSVGKTARWGQGMASIIYAPRVQSLMSSAAAILYPSR